MDQPLAQVSMASDGVKTSAEVPAAVRSGYRPEIDGLRAFAVAAVIINHFNKDLLPNGFLGVDIFFVISGYVITSSLSARKSPGFWHFLGAFYERRIRRLVPALVVFVMITSLLIAFFNPDPRSAHEIGKESLFGLAKLSLYNLSIDYFAQSAALNPFTHTWSLGVEEQFYLLFPCLVWFSGFARQAKHGARNLFLWLCGLAIASLLGFVLLYPVNQPAAYFLMPTRFWELASGCLVFLLFFHGKASAGSFFKPIFPLLSAVAIGVAMMIPVDSPVLLTVVVVAFSSLLIIGLKQGTLVFDLLTKKGVIWIGLISYSLYLWHWVVLSISRWTVGIHWWTAPFQVALMLLIASASYRWIENPFRKRLPLMRRPIVILQGLFMVFLSLFGLQAIASGSGWLYLGSAAAKPVNIAKSDYGLPEFKSTIDAASKKMDQCNMTPYRLAGKVYSPQPMVSESFARKCMFEGVAGRPNVILVGDSFASISTPYVAAVASELNYGFGVLFGYGCPYPLPFSSLKFARATGCPGIDEKLLYNTLVNGVRPGDIVVLRLYLPKGQYIDYRSAGAAQADHYDESLGRLARDLSRRGATMLLIGANPTLNDAQLMALNPQWFNSIQSTRGQSFPRSNSKETDMFLRFDKRLEDVASRDGWRYFPTSRYLCSPDRCFLRIDGNPLYVDDHHLSSYAMKRYFGDLRSALFAMKESRVEPVR
jgi:peptidoglycan/LPS O-acetylase OafA/YrhL